MYSFAIAGQKGLRTLRNKQLGASAFVVTAVAALTACSGSDSTPSAPISPSTVTVTTSAETITLATAITAFENCMATTEQMCFSAMTRVSKAVDELGDNRPPRVKGLMFSYSTVEGMFVQGQCGLPEQTYTNQQCKFHADSMIRVAKELDTEAKN